MSISADEFNEKSPLNSDQPKTLTTVISNRKANRSVFLNPEFKTDKFEIKFDENNFSFLDQNQNQSLNEIREKIKKVSYLGSTNNFTN